MINDQQDRGITLTLRLVLGGILLFVLAATLSCRQQRTVDDAVGGQDAQIGGGAEAAMGSAGEIKTASPASNSDAAEPVTELDATAAAALQQSWADRLEQPVELTNSIGMKLVLIPPGELLMGTPDSDRAAHAAAKPQHRVWITGPFYLGRYEVTQEQYQRMMGDNPSRFQGKSQRPVENVAWTDAVEFCRRLSELPTEQAAGRVYRLPTEAQWEYACRAGSTTAYSHGDSAERLGDYAWYHDNSDGTTHPVGQKLPNAWGLYDMHGNVWEWCADWYGPDYYATSPTDDPTGPKSGEYRVFRGGGWRYLASSCTAAFRSRGNPELPGDGRGFRVWMWVVEGVLSS